MLKVRLYGYQKDVHLLLFDIAPTYEAFKISIMTTMVCDLSHCLIYFGAIPIMDPLSYEKIVHCISVNQEALVYVKLSKPLCVDREPLSAVSENILRATDEIPECFSNVEMLYLKVQINNMTTIAFVDTGAQVTVMDKGLAEGCGLSSIIDTRYKGFLMGVGKREIYGKIHYANMVFNAIEIPISCIVVQNSQMPLLLGLDVLRRYQCNIDLKRNIILWNEKYEVSLSTEKEVHEILHGFK